MARNVRTKLLRLPVDLVDDGGQLTDKVLAYVPQAAGHDGRCSQEPAGNHKKLLN